MNTPAYDGPSGQTSVENTHIGCECGFTIAFEIHRSIHVNDDPELVELFYRNELDRAVCPSCGRSHVPQVPRVFHDPRLPALVLDLPREFRHRELELTAELLRTLDKEGANIPVYAKRPAIVYGADALREFLATGGECGVLARDRPNPEAGADDLKRRLAEVRRKEAELRSLEETLERQRVDLFTRINSFARAGEQQAVAADVASRSASLARPGEEAALTTAKNGVLELADRPQTDIDRWRAGEGRTGAFLHEGRVYCVARPGPALDEFCASPPRMLVQLHELDGVPLLACAALRASAGYADDQALYWMLDPRVERQRAIAERLAEDFTFELDLYDDESRARASWRVSVPLRENAALSLIRADELLDSSADAEVSTDALAAAFEGLGAERLGHRDPHLEHDAFSRLVTPGATRAALSVVDHWSTPANETYLLLIRSFPIPYWRDLRRRVIEAALRFGLCLGDALESFAVEHGLAPSRRALRERLRDSFVELSLGRRPNDLDASQEWVNWRDLATRCAEEGIEIGEQAQRLIQASGWRTRQLLKPYAQDAQREARMGAVTNELELNDILETREMLDQEEELEDGDIVDEVIIAESADESADADDLLDDEGDDDEPGYDEPDSLTARTVEISEDDIIERKSSDSNTE